MVGAHNAAVHRVAQLKFRRTKGHGQCQVAATVSKRPFRQGATNFFCHAEGAGLIRFRTEDKEFLASPACQAVHLTGELGHGVRYVAQHLVAHLVAEFIVDPLEVVNVREQHGKRAAGAVKSFFFMVKLLQHSASVG